MVTTKIASANIFVFPCVSRYTGNEQDNLNAKLMSEKNITNIIKSITDKKSYVISWDDIGPLAGVLVCVIDGYYFEVTLPKPTSGELYAKHVRKNDPENDLIDGDDADYLFNGLELLYKDASEATDVEGYLPLWVEGGVPSTSYHKFSLDSIFGVSIDCGEPPKV
jgi:hypothetical protein